MSHSGYSTKLHSYENGQMLIKYETLPQNDIYGVPRERVKFCSRFFIFFSIFLCLLLIYIPIYYQPTFARKQFDDIVEGWGANTSRSLPLYITPLSDTAVIADRSCCSEPLRLLIVVCSAVKNFNERITIRETWGNFSSQDYRLVFLLGQTMNVTMEENVKAESYVFNDIIQEGFVDSYNNLTLKSVMLLKQVVNYCQNVKYILKSDDDMFVHVLNLLQLINHIEELKIRNVLLGELICDAKPIQDINSKWFSPNYMFDGKVYPRYLSGTGYLMDKTAAVKLYNAALVTPFFHLEDVYITGLCAKGAVVKPRDHAGFSYQTRPMDPCLYKTNRYIITSHRVSPEKMQQLWSSLNSNKTCKQEIRPPRLRTRLMPPFRRNIRC